MWKNIFTGESSSWSRLSQKYSDYGAANADGWWHVDDPNCPVSF